MVVVVVVAAVVVVVTPKYSDPLAFLLWLLSVVLPRPGPAIMRTQQRGN